jgi:hypothetical protein
VVNEVLFHALEKGEEFSLLLSRDMANTVADGDEKVGHPGKKVFVTDPTEC